MRVPGVPYVQGRNSYTDADGMHYGIAIHNTSNNASDESEASFATRRTDGTSAHFYVDRDSVTQSLDTNARSGHAGSSQGNQNALSFELTGGNATTRAQWLAGIDWAELGRVIAYILTHDPDYKGFKVRRASVAEMKSNPKVKAFYGHDDMRRAWGGTTHTDPGAGFPWDRLFASVNEHLKPPVPPPAPVIERKAPDMLMLIKPNDPTVWLSFDGRERVGLSQPAQRDALIKSGVPGPIPVKDETELTYLGGPARPAS